jgi:hypothetical protein
MRTLRKTFLYILLLASLLAGGCAPAGKSAADALLAGNYHIMSDDELARYFRQINDRLAVEKRASRDKSLLGRTDPTIAEDLWQRRSEVQMEMDRRGLP